MISIRRLQSLGLMGILFGLLLYSGAPSFANQCQIAMVFDVGGKDDKSFNTSAFEGLMKTKKELGCAVKYVEPSDHNSFEPLLKAFAQKNYDLIIAVGVAQVDAVKKVAGQFPDKKFVILDGEVNAANVRSYLFEEQEGSYLVGAIAAMSSKSKQVGFIGGMDIPLIRRFATGYEAGAKAIQPQIKVVMNYDGNTAEAWNNPAKGKELALMQYSQGVDVIFGVAGASGSGIFDAAEEKKKYAIGVDSNQNWMKPGVVLTSMVKKIDHAVFSVSQDLVQKKFAAGTVRFDLSNEGVGFSVDQHNEKILTPDVRKKADQLKSQIITKKVRVPDYYQIRKKS